MKRLFSFIFLSLLLVLTTANGASAMSDSAMLQKVIDRPIYYQEFKTINYLIFKKNVNFTVKDLRELLRNWVGKSATAKQKINTNILITGTVQKNKVKKSKHCVYNQYILQNNKIIKERLGRRYCPARGVMRKRSFWGKFYPVYSHLYVKRPAHLKKFALLVNKILKKYPSVYKNINSQGRHYQTALYIASARGMTYVVYFLLKDKYINPAITSLSVGDYHITTFNGTTGANMSPYFDNLELVIYGAKNRFITYEAKNDEMPIQVFLRNIAKPTPFDISLRKRMNCMTYYHTRDVWEPYGLFGQKDHGQLTFDKRYSGRYVDSIAYFIMFNNHFSGTGKYFSLKACLAKAKQN